MSRHTHPAVGGPDVGFDPAVDPGAIQLPTVSVVVAVYNSERSLRELVSRLRDVLPDVASVYELILVNDGSRDWSWTGRRWIT